MNSGSGSGAAAPALGEAVRRTPKWVLGLLLVLGAAWAGWSLGCTLTPGVYLGNLEASQFIVQPRLESTIPILWVPRWPWSPVPEFGGVSLTLDDGTVLPMTAEAPTFHGIGPYRTGYLCIYPQALDGLPTGAGPAQYRVASISVESSYGLLASNPRSLYAVSLGAPVNQDPDLFHRMTSTFLIDQEAFCLDFSVQSGSEVEVVEIVLPPEAYPLAIATAGSADRPVTLPLILEPGDTRMVTSITGKAQHGSISLMPLLRIRRNGEEGYYYPFSACFHFVDSRLTTQYDVGR